jgi:hypothetical protein
MPAEVFGLGSEAGLYDRRHQVCRREKNLKTVKNRGLEFVFALESHHLVSLENGS